MSLTKSKIILSIILILSLSFSISVSANESTVSTKADTLVNLKVLIGDGNGLNLTGQLSRSEAITFIVRIMGQEKAVLNSKDKYSLSSFSDVKKTDWYAPMVGFGVEQKFISGFPDGNFHPNEKISEKAFLTLLLRALGHKINEDFTWNTVYSYAASIGLINVDQQSQTKDNLQYKREDVVNVIYDSLTLTNKQTKVKVIDTLDPKHVLAPIFAPTPTPTPTPIPDSLITAISVTSVQSENKISIKFNENIKTISADKVLIYETGNKELKLASSIDSQTANEVVLITNLQKINQDYTIEFNNLTDDQGHISNLVSSNFKGFTKPEIKSDYFKISKINTLSKNSLDVYFTQPINGNVELPMNYEIQKAGVSLVKGTFSNLSVKALMNKDNIARVYLKSDFISEPGIYSLKVSGDVTSIYGIKLNDGAGDSQNFSSNAADSTLINLVQVMPIDDKTIQVIFNQEVDTISAVQPTNYSIISSNGIPRSVIRAIISGEGEQKGKVVLLGIAGTLDKTYNYDVTVKNVMDKLKINTIAESKYPIVGQSVLPRKDLAIINVTAEDKGTLSVYFDRKLDNNNAVNTAYYSLTGVNNGFSTTIIKAYYDPIMDPYRVKLYLAGGQGLSSGATYKLQVLNSMLDELGGFSLNNTTMDFTTNGSDIVKPLIYEALIIGKDTIRFRTNMEILNTGMNVATSNYSLEYKDGSNTVTKQAAGMSLIDAKTGILKFDNLDISKSYTLKFISLTDYANINTRLAADGLTSYGVSLGTN